MNFLAHLYLADDTPHSLIGNMLGDFVDGDFRSRYNTEICRGILLHRKVDVFTDNHPVFLHSKRRISNEYRLLKGIMVDLFYDHFLAKNWREYCQMDLEKFSDYIYGIFMDHQEMLPPRMQRMLPAMIAGNWLMSYQYVDGVGKALRGLSGRISRQNRLAESVKELRRHYNEFELDFQEFFPELIAYVETIKGDDYKALDGLVETSGS